MQTYRDRSAIPRKRQPTSPPRGARLRSWLPATMLLMSGFGPALSSTPLPFAEALRLAEQRSPQIMAADHAIASARERAVSGAQLPDPVLRAGVDNLPVAGADRFSLGRDFMTMRRIGVMPVNRGKRSISIDLKSADGKKAFDDLVRQADAVIYGFAPAVPARLGLDFATLSAINPRIVVAQIVGLDDKGEYANAPAFDLMLQAMSGVMSITGEEGGKPVRVGYQVADLAGGLYLALATTAALVKALTTGKGEQIQISLFDAQIAMLTWQAQVWLSGGPVPRATGARHAMIAPSDTYRAADGKWLALAPTGDAFWRKLCDAIDRPELADDARFNDAAGRIRHVEELTGELARAIALKPAAKWMVIFSNARVPAAVVQGIHEALQHPLIQARQMVEQVARPDGAAALPMLGNPFKYAGTPVLAYPPALGADTAEVFERIAGYSPEQIAQLAKSRAIAVATERGDKP